MTARGMLAYHANWTVDDEGREVVARVVRQHLGPPMVSAAITTALLQLVASEPLGARPEVSGVTVVAQPPSPQLDPEGPLGHPDGQALLAAFLTDLLAWDAEGHVDAAHLPSSLTRRARALLAALAGAPEPAAGWVEEVATQPVEAALAGVIGRGAADRAALEDIAGILTGPAPTLAKVAGVLRRAGLEVPANPGRSPR